MHPILQSEDEVITVLALSELYSGHLRNWIFNIPVDSQRLYTLFAFCTFLGHNLVYLFLVVFSGRLFFYFIFFNPSSSESENIV